MEPNDPRQEFLKSVYASALGLQMVDYLGTRGRIPQFSVGTTQSPWSQGEYSPKTNTIHLGHGWTMYQDTIPHELAHATENALSEQYFSIPYSDRKQGKSKFAEAYRKLMLDTKLANVFSSLPFRNLDPREWLANQLDPRWFADNRDYRSRSPELTAWGVETHSGVGGDKRRDPHKSPPHLNATMATELAILMDLATRESIK